MIDTIWWDIFAILGMSFVGVSVVYLLWCAMIFRMNHIQEKIQEAETEELVRRLRQELNIHNHQADILNRNEEYRKDFD